MSESARTLSAELAEPRWLTRREAHDVNSAIYLLILRDVVVYVGETYDLHTRLYWHSCIHADSKHFDRARVLPIVDDKRTRAFVEKHVRGLVGPTIYNRGTSVRDRIEMRRPGPEVDVSALAGTRVIEAVVLFLRWVLSKETVDGKI